MGIQFKGGKEKNDKREGEGNVIVVSNCFKRMTQMSVVGVGQEVFACMCRKERKEEEEKKEKEEKEKEAKEKEAKEKEAKEKEAKEKEAKDKDK